MLPLVYVKITQLGKKMANTSGLSINVTDEERALVVEAEKLTGLSRKALILSLVREKILHLKGK